MAKQNVCGVDRAVRAVFGTASLATSVFLFLGNSAWAIPVLIVGVVLLFTALTGFCGLYVPFGISTCSGKPRNQKARDGD